MKKGGESIVDRKSQSILIVIFVLIVVVVVFNETTIKKPKRPTTHDDVTDDGVTTKNEMMRNLTQFATTNIVSPKRIAEARMKRIPESSDVSENYKEMKTFLVEVARLTESLKNNANAGTTVRITDVDKKYPRFVAYKNDAFETLKRVGYFMILYDDHTISIIADDDDD